MRNATDLCTVGDQASEACHSSRCQKLKPTPWYLEQQDLRLMVDALQDRPSVPLKPGPSTLLPGAGRGFDWLPTKRIVQGLSYDLLTPLAFRRPSELQQAKVPHQSAENVQQLPKEEC